MSIEGVIAGLILAFGIILAGGLFVMLFAVAAPFAEAWAEDKVNERRRKKKSRGEESGTKI